MRYYSKKEDQVIIDCVRKSPSNIRRAMKEASSKIGRSSASCTNRYYGNLRGYSKAFRLESGDTQHKMKFNTKNEPRRCQAITYNELVLQMFGTLSPQDKINFLTHLIK